MDSGSQRVSVLTEAPRVDRGFGRGLFFGLLFAGITYGVGLAVFVLVEWVT